MVAGIEIGDAHGAERDAGRRQIVGVGALAIPLEMGARQDDGRRIGGGRRLLRDGRRLDRAVELPLVVEGARSGEVGPLRRRRAAEEDHQGHRKRRGSNRCQGHR